MYICIYIYIHMHIYISLCNVSSNKFRVNTHGLRPKGSQPFTKFKTSAEVPLLGAHYDRAQGRLQSNPAGLDRQR